MAWGIVGSLGTATSTSANQSSLVLTTSATLEVGNVGIINVSCDNHQTTDGDEVAVTSVVDSAGNTWTKFLEYCNGQGTAQAGATTSIWRTIATSQLNSGGTITANFSNAASRDACSATADEFTIASGSTLSLDSSTTLSIDAAASGSALTLSGLTSRERLWYRGQASEMNTDPQGTVTSGWTASTLANANTGTGATSMCASGEFIIATAAGVTSDPSINSSRDCAAVLLAIREIVLAPAGITVSAITKSTTEAGGTGTFTVVLDSQPTNDVVVGLTSDDLTEGTVSPASLTFTSVNWETPQTVTVTGVDDALDDGDIAFNIITAAATSADLNYNGINASNVAVTNIDHDSTGLIVPNATWVASGIPTGFGVVGSGYAGSPPTDSVRSGPKPIGRFAVMPYTVNTSQVQIAVGAADGKGIAKVRFYCEGNTCDVTARTVFEGLPGFHVVTLDVPSISIPGEVRIYAELFSRDSTRQTRVIGPLDVWVDPGNVIAGSATDPDYYIDGTFVGVGLGTLAAPFQTVAEAVAKFRTVSASGGTGQFLTAGTYTVPGTLTAYTGPTRWIKLKPHSSLPAGSVVITSTTGYTGTLRLKCDKLWWEGVTFDASGFDTYFTENNNSAAFVDIEVYDPLGCQAIRNQSPRTTNCFRPFITGGVKLYGIRPYFHDVQSAISGFELLINPRMERICGDFYLNNPARFGIYGAAFNADTLRVHINALTVAYAGVSATATVAKTGANGQTSGTLTLIDTVNGTNAIPLIENMTISQLVTAINVFAGWTATLQDNTLRAKFVTKSDAVGFGSFLAVTAKDVTVQLTTGIDIHGDFVQDQDAGSLENFIDIAAKYDHNGATGAGVVHITQGYFLSDVLALNDYAIVLADIRNPAGLSYNSQISTTCDHMVIDSCSWKPDGQSILFRTDALGADKYIPTNCVIRNSSMPTCGNLPVAGLDIDNCNFYVNGVGTNATSGDPGVDTTTGRPNIGSNLLSRVAAPYEFPQDRAGRALTGTAAIGAYQYYVSASPGTPGKRHLRLGMGVGL